MFVVLFEVHPHTAQLQQYLNFGKLLRPELENVNGFIDNERFSNVENEGRILSLSTWRDEKALIRWRTHAQHHHVQEQGRSLVFADYRLRVAEVVADSATPGGHELQQHRFDETEISPAKAITLLEIEPVVEDVKGYGAMIDSAYLSEGWIESADFTSLYQPGKRINLASWSTIDSARAWYAQHVAPIGHPAVRSRLVRVIRAYGMADRIEAPQYYPAVPSSASIW